MLNVSEEVSSRTTAESILRHFGSEPDAQGRWRCLFPARHTNGDTHHSLTIQAERVTCWSQGCFRKSDIFEIVGKMEGITDFKQQVRKAAQLAGLAPGGHAERRVAATYDYVDETNNLLFHLWCNRRDRFIRHRHSPFSKVFKEPFALFTQPQ
jgi:hypothetical protein